MSWLITVYRCGRSNGNTASPVTLLLHSTMDRCPRFGASRHGCLVAHGRNIKGGNQLDRRKTRPIPAHISCQQLEARYRRMSADKEVRQGSRSSPTAPPVTEEGLPGQKRRLERKVFAPIDVRGECLLDVLDASKTDRDLRLDDRIDHHDGFVGCSLQRGRGPLEPGPVSRGDVEENAAVD